MSKPWKFRRSFGQVVDEIEAALRPGFLVLVCLITGLGLLGLWWTTSR